MALREWTPAIVACGLAILVGFGAYHGRSDGVGGRVVPGNFASPATAPSWSYSTRRDEVNSGEVDEATLRSTNVEPLSFPYRDTALTLIIRRHPRHGTDLAFVADDGQIMCSIGGCSATLNLNGRPRQIWLMPSSDGSTRAVFASGARGLIDQIRRSSRAGIELTFFQQGSRQFFFQTGGLQWPPPRTSR